MESSKINKFSILKLKKIFLNRKIQISLLIIFGFLIAGGLGFVSHRIFLKKPWPSFEYFLSLKETKKKKIKEQPEKILFPGKLDGLMVEKREIIPIAVIIENHIASRPQAGLDRAKIVFETVAEGGITRFLAIFVHNQDLEKIGPVRSARPYFLEWTKEFNALFVHSGGSPQALGLIPKYNIFDLNQISQDQRYFWRERKRTAPHNLYTSSHLLNKAIKDKKIEIPFFEEWKFKKEEIFLEETTPSAKTKIETPQTQRITIDFSTSSYKVEYIYNSEKKAYQRFIANRPDLTEEGREIYVKNLIIQTVKKGYYDNTRLRLETIGQGKAFVCFEGRCQSAKWEKSGLEKRTRFYSLENGDEIEFIPGNTWIEIIFPDIEVLIS